MKKELQEQSLAKKVEDHSEASLCLQGDDNDDNVGHKAHEEEERKSLKSKSSNKTVNLLRFAVYLGVVVTAVVVCVLVYIFTKEDEQQSFQDNFAAFADKLVE